MSIWFWANASFWLKRAHNKSNAENKTQLTNQQTDSQSRNKSAITEFLVMYRTIAALFMQFGLLLLFFVCWFVFSLMGLSTHLRKSKIEKRWSAKWVKEVTLVPSFYWMLLLNHDFGANSCNLNLKMEKKNRVSNFLVRWWQNPEWTPTTTSVSIYRV